MGDPETFAGSCDFDGAQLVDTLWEMSFRAPDGQSLVFNIPATFCPSCQNLEQDEQVLHLLDLDETDLLQAVESEVAVLHRVTETNS